MLNADLPDTGVSCPEFRRWRRSESRMSTARTQTWTIRKLLTWVSDDLAARGMGTPRLDAELLLGRALGCDRLALYTDLERPLEPPELARARELVARRRRHEPVAYILGEREFYGRAFEVTRDVLIPRPETETLVERALSSVESERPCHILDLGTGSGAIAVSLLAECPSARADATDISSRALSVAARNARRHRVSDRIVLHEGDLFEALGKACGNSPKRRMCPDYDIIACNPPYIAAHEWEGLSPDITRHEPKVALVGGEDGLFFLGRVCAVASHWLRPGGTLLLEVGQGQGRRVVDMLRACGGFLEISTHRDLGGVERVVQASTGRSAEFARL